MTLGLGLEDWIIYLIPTVLLALGFNMPSLRLARFFLGLGLLTGLYALYWTIFEPQHSYLHGSITKFLNWQHEFFSLK